MPKRTTAELDRPSQGRARKAKTSTPKFEIVYEDPSAGTIWSELKRTVEPVADAVRNVLGGAYVIAARAVLQKIEAFEDGRATRRADRHAAELAVLKAEPTPAPRAIAGPAAAGGAPPKRRRAAKAVSAAPPDETPAAVAKPVRASRKTGAAATKPTPSPVAKPRRSARRTTRTRS